MQLIDLATLAADLPGSFPSTAEESGVSLEVTAAAATAFLTRLKDALEARGGIWLRLAPFPFPFQRAIALAVRHLEIEEHSEPELRRTFPRHVTHFVPTRLRRTTLLKLKAAGADNLAWLVTPRDLDSTTPRTLAAWKARLARFAELDWRIQGLLPLRDDLPLPSTRQLRELGFQYACHRDLGRVGRLIAAGHVRADRTWVRLTGISAGTPLSTHGTDGNPQSGYSPTRILLSSPHIDSRHRLDPAHVLSDEPVLPVDGTSDTAILSEADPLGSWVVENTHAGLPLCILESTERLDVVRELLNVAGDSGRYGLIWQPTFCQLAQWTIQRRRLQLQVWRTAAGYEIHAEGLFGDWRCGLEIWRGTHRASLPLSGEVVTIKDDGLVFLRDDPRSAVACDLPPPEAPAPLPSHHSSSIVKTLA